MNVVYGKKISCLFFDMNQIIFLKNKITVQEVQNKQHKLNRKSKLAIPTKHQNETCNKLGSNTIATEN